MIRFITVFSLFLTFSSSAACWIVEDVRGSSYADRNQYQREDDGFKGKFTILVTGQAATVLYDGADAGGMSYRPLTENVVVGLSSEPGKHAMETWVIQQDGTVLLTKTISGFPGFDSAKAMVGHVSGHCE